MTRVPKKTVFLRFARHPAWVDYIQFHPTGRFFRLESGCWGSWRLGVNGGIHLEWDDWDPEILTADGDILSAAPNGLPVVDLEGRTANQYIWLAYAMRIGAGALRPNHHDGYCLDGITHGLEVLPPIDKKDFYGSRWHHAASWRNLLQDRPRLRSLLLSARLEKIEAISLHVRLGDKVGNGHYVPFTREFAAEALDLMPENLQVNVFSDSPQQAQELLGDLRPHMCFSGSASAREDFLRISAHSYQIVPDSTFSWMAAFLSPFRKKVVCLTCPERDGELHAYPEFQIVRHHRGKNLPENNSACAEASPTKAGLDVLVISPGGMGCTYMLNSMWGLWKTNDPNDSDGLKHFPDPTDPRFSGMTPRVVYVWNDPLKAILSHHRRGWLQQQCSKLQGTVEATESLESLWDCCLKGNSDVFGILNHAENWLTDCPLPLFFLDLRKLNAEKENLGDFLGGSVRHLAMRPRASYSEIQVPAGVRSLYASIDSKVVLLGLSRNEERIATSAAD